MLQQTSLMSSFMVLAALVSTQVHLKKAAASPMNSKPCIMCDMPIPAEVAQSPAEDVCDDLGYAACTDNVGGSRYSSIIKELQAQMNGTITSALDKAARAYGEASSEEFILKEIEAGGIRLRKDLSADLRSYVVGNGSKLTWVDTSSYSSDLKECKDKAAEIQKFSSYSETDPEKLRTALTNLENFISYHRDVQAKLYMFDTNSFLSVLASKCKELNEAEKKSLKPLALGTTLIGYRLKLACQDPNGFRRQVLQTYRSQSAVEQKKLIDNMMPALAIDLNSLIVSESSTSTPRSTDVVTKLRERYQKLQQATLWSCNGYLENGLRKLRSQARSKLIKSRPFVEAMIEQVYPESRTSYYHRLFDEVKREVKKVALKVTTDEQKRAAILAQYDRLNLHMLTKPDAKLYNKDPKTGVEILSDEVQLTDDVLGAAFGDPSLGFFTELNAFYTPDIKIGEQVRNTKVAIMPMFFLLAEKNPFTFVSVMAHEAGHQIGPMVSYMNGFDLRSEYRPLMQCLAEPESIRMQKHQADESTADFVSAEALAVLIGQLPARKQRAAALASIGDFCYFNATKIGSMNIWTDGGHPEDMLRISGIYGGNSSFRKVLGCQKPSRTFKTCDLETARR